MNQEEWWLLKEKYKGVESEAFHADCERLKAGEPLAYLIGHLPFLGCTICLDSKPLIPRPETEFWTEALIKSSQNKENLRILDLCAGSGCVGVALLKALPNARVDFAEIDAIHLPTIQKNIKANVPPETAERTVIYSSDLFVSIPPDKKYDVIASNPPYIDPALDRTEVSVKSNEPHLALYGGEGGLACIVKIIETAPQYLTSGGQLWLEHEPEQVATIKTLASQAGFTTTLHPDQYDVMRYTVLALD